jgi:hypothetical protein
MPLTNYGDADHLPTLADIVGRLPDGADYDDGLEARDPDKAEFEGGYVRYREQAANPEVGFSAGELHVEGVVPESYERIPLRKFRLTLEEIRRDAAPIGVPTLTPAPDQSWDGHTLALSLGDAMVNLDLVCPWAEETFTHAEKAPPCRRWNGTEEISEECFSTSWWEGAGIECLDANGKTIPITSLPVRVNLDWRGSGEDAELHVVPLPGPATGIPCCPDLARALQSCELHPESWDDCDCVLIRTPDGGLGMPVRDGGSSWIEVGFCPFCGAKVGGISAAAPSTMAGA